MLNSDNSTRKAVSGFVVILILAVLFLPVPAKAEWVGNYVNSSECDHFTNKYRHRGEINDSSYDYNTGICNLHFIMTDIRCKRLYGEYTGLRNGYCVPVEFKYGGEPDEVCRRMYGRQSWYSYHDNTCMDAQRMLTNADCQTTYGPNYFAYEGRCILGYKPSQGAGTTTPNSGTGSTPPSASTTPPGSGSTSPSSGTTSPNSGTATPAPTSCPAGQCYDTMQGGCVDENGIHACDF